MENPLSIEELTALNLEPDDTEMYWQLLQQLAIDCQSKRDFWLKLNLNESFQKAPFSLHIQIFTRLFPDWRTHPEKYPVWRPEQFSGNINLLNYLNEKDCFNFQTLQKWSHENYPTYWSDVVSKLGIRFSRSTKDVVDLQAGITKPVWFPNAKLNIAESCFSAPPNSTAIICQHPNGKLERLSYADLDKRSNRIANGLLSQGFKKGDAIAIIMPMNTDAVTIYLAIIKMGGVVVSIPDSFSDNEIRSRLEIMQTKAIFTQDTTIWAGKHVALLDKIRKIKNASNDYSLIVIPFDNLTATINETEDYNSWHNLLKASDDARLQACDPMDSINILFSSGTTSTPKAIPWNHTTPMKVAADAYFHQNIQPGDILAWPTNLGWMMGPWLIFAALINKATIALFPDAPRDDIFGKFVADIGVTMLGVVPTMVSAWRKSKCMEKVNWNKIKIFSSTGECSNPEDMFYLMWLGRCKPIIEYCGGTEIGGAYISSTVIQPNCPSILTTPTMGTAFVILDEDGKITNDGEVAIIPPSIGLSTTLINKDHEDTYYADMPTIANNIPLRKHGDHVKRLSDNAYMMQGRVDDTMNLSGIKISTAEIERAINQLDGISEIAAVAVSPQSAGPQQLIIFATLLDKSITPDITAIKKEIQTRINQKLNPLFKLSDLVFVQDMPKTASNKILRRTLRDMYINQYAN